jgi:DNA modification methylase
MKNPKDIYTKDIFRDDFSQDSLFDKSLEQEIEQKVECLGKTFDNDEVLRAYYLDILRDKLIDPEFRKIEGFPIGGDEDILALSDPPYYTACPNPFIDDFIKLYGKPYESTVPYSREPFAADVSEGKNDPIYNAHSYHTKVPHRAIMRYILHYTEPGDIVLDGFCGTGMTGVAAQLCGDVKTVESLGYKVNPDGIIIEEEGKPFSKVGGRLAILNDLSPAATFIAYNYNAPVDVSAFEREAKRILKEVEEECGWMYETIHSDGKTKGRINYTVWSDVFICPQCTREVIFWEVAVAAGKVLDEFACPHCKVMLTKKKMERAWVTIFDKAIGQTIRQARQIPVLINYSVGKKRFEKTLDSEDFALIDKIDNSDIPYWFPRDRMPEGDESRRNDRIGITHAHHFYTKRNLWVLAGIIIRCNKLLIKLVFQSIVSTLCSRLVRYNMGNRGNGHLSGTLYVSSMNADTNPMWVIASKINDFAKAFKSSQHNVITNQSTSSLGIKKKSIDYIFTDPPFGSNLMYSELNFLWEAWLKVFTNNKSEAIENKTQGKSLYEYQVLMTQCFSEYYRVLKPGRWMTVEFHNSKNTVWNSIQVALQHAGFVVADVRTLDKQQGSFKQVTSGGSVKQDLIISAYKPNYGLEERFKLISGTDEGVWEFIRAHLRYLPVFVSKKDKLEVLAERQDYLLFDRMVAFHLQRGVPIPISAPEFYEGLAQRFSERDGMYFLSEQTAEYDKKRLTIKEILQLELFIKDEASAIQWLKQQIIKKPQTFQDIHPLFMREIAGWQKHEKSLELMELLEQNFIQYDDIEEVPSQIHSYLSTNFKELRNLSKDNPILKAKARGRWYVPDPNKAADLEKLREKALLREFEQYRGINQKRLKVFRLEAVRAGFKRAFQERNYQIIIDISLKIPEDILHEDPKLLMWYDQAVTRLGGK